MWYADVSTGEPRGAVLSKRIVITVDGVGASGKSALARLLAERLGFAHLNSGLLYRAAAWLVSEAGANPSSDSDVGGLLASHSIALRYADGVGARVLIDGVIRDEELTTQENTRLASIVAKLPAVREHFKPIQRDAFAPKGVVAEGRDMGTIIFPDAPVKFFVVADLGVRAARRQRQQAERGEVADVHAIAEELKRRDESDASREIAPMKAADGAILIDNSVGTLEETVATMLTQVRAAVS